MNIWSVFVTGLFAGGASCAAVQGGLLAGAVARRQAARPAASDDDAEDAPAEAEEEATAGGGGAGVSVLTKPKPATRLADDAAPVGAFLAGKLVSHTLFGALLGLFGAALQPNFRVRAYMQIAAGVVMILMALNLLGLFGKRSFLLTPPESFTRLVRRSARAESAFTPAVIGFLTVLVPCGVTLSVEFLVIANGSAVSGAAAMAAFVIGTSPLFAAIGYAVRRAGSVLHGHLNKLAAIAVAVAGVLSINSGLVLSGSGVTLQRVAPGIAKAVPPVLGGGAAATEGLSGKPSDSSQPVATATVGAEGIQVVEVTVTYGEPEGGGAPFSPSIVQARAGVPTVLKFMPSGDLGCAGVVVLPRRGIEKGLRSGTETVIELGVLDGDVGYSCGTGMYGGTIKVVGG
ncbi:MAG: sulfite exporter TauE/SafE family protein [Acidimicrobiales bacterium]